MQINYKLPHFFSSANNLSLDKEKFNYSQPDIEQLCHFFSLGKLRHYKKEKGVAFAHFNLFVFVKTTQGEYALKFYTPDHTSTPLSIAIEYALNRVLINHHFLTPLMHIGINGKAYCPIKNLLATCYTYIDGSQACQAIKQRNTFSKINAAMFSLKNILATTDKRLNFPKEESLATTIHTLIQNSKRKSPYEQKDLIDAFLLDACRAYQHHQQLFSRQLIHNNTHIDNFLIHKRNIYTLDLSHVREDYALVDLVGIIMSCIFLNMPTTTSRNIINDYFNRHQLGANYLPVIDTLAKIKLIEEYLKLLTYSPKTMRSHMPHLSKQRKSIINALKKTDNILKSMI